jgi:hypothetical protein
MLCFSQVPQESFAIRLVFQAATIRTGFAELSTHSAPELRERRGDFWYRVQFQDATKAHPLEPDAKSYDAHTADHADD